MSTISWTQASTTFARQDREDKIQEQQLTQKFEQTKLEAKDEVMSRIYDDEEPFSYNDIEDIMHGYGLEMDYIEEFLL